MNAKRKAAIKSSITKCTDHLVLNELAKHIRERKDQINRDVYETKKAALWDEIRNAKIGSQIYVCCEGTFLGGPFQRGDSMTITHIQPRAKRIWATANGKQYGFDAAGIARYTLRTTPPTLALPRTEREIVDRIVSRLGNVAAAVDTHAKT